MNNKRLDVGKVLKFKVTGLLDVDGNLLNQWAYKKFDQFREFFAQETENLFKLPQDILLMNTGKPIFKDQPVSKPDNFGDYWKNTPLKTIEK